MDEIVLTDRLIQQGFSRDEIGRLCRTGGLQRVRRGAYRPAPEAAPTPTQLHRQLNEDLLRQVGRQVVRWVWADLSRFGPVRDRLRAAFARGRLIA